MKNKIVITGITGFVGSNIARFLVQQNYDIFAIIRVHSDLSTLNDIKDEVNFLTYDQDLKKLIAFFKEVEPNCVLHLASNFIAEHKSNQIDSLVDSNIKFGLHVLEAMKESGVKNLINTGTSWQHFKNEEYNPVCLYAATKQAYEALIEYYVKAENFKVITLKLFDTYGENDTRPKLINLLHKFADEGTVLKMSAGEQKLNLVHIEDVCKAYLIAYKQLIRIKSSIHLTYSVEEENSYKLKEVISLFEKVTGKNLKIEWGGRPYRKREVMELWRNGMALPDWKPNIGLEDGLKRYDLKK